MTNLKTFCVTNVSNKYLEKLNIDLVGVGKKIFPTNYLTCDNKINIQEKESYYSELTFHYWLWKNMLNDFEENTWIGLCQKRRFWVTNSDLEIKNIDQLNENILREIPAKLEIYDAILCKPIKVSPAKTMKLIKKGWKNIIKDPSVLFNKHKHNLKLQFDMFHGYGNMDKALRLLPKNEQIDFNNYLEENIEFNPNIMVIAKKKILNKWFENLFNWLFECEKVFGFKNLKGYETGRLYAYLSERYLSYWFNSKCNITYNPWIFFDITKIP